MPTKTMNWLQKIANQNEELQSILNKWKSFVPELVLYVFEYDDRIVLSNIIVPKSKRKQGIGSQIMHDLTMYADQKGKRIELSPGIKDSYHGTTSRKRLVNFYKRFGFLENKGRNKDYRMTETMFRNPVMAQVFKNLIYGSKDFDEQYYNPLPQAESTTNQIISFWSNEFPVVLETIDGLTIRSEIPNTSSISASFDNYYVLPDIRSISMKGWGTFRDVFYAKDDFDQSKNLAHKINQTQEINPLIVGIDESGPYIVEGMHRLAALLYLGKNYFPALVVLDGSLFSKATQDRDDHNAS